MATYQPGMTDIIPDQTPFTPDYSFLRTVLGTQQQRYDQGFDQMKGLYNSLLSSPILNKDNQDFRHEWFRKAGTALRSVATTDLSDPSNVAAAKNIFSPITNDTELMHDMVVTSGLRKSLRLADEYADSPDPNKRALYNEKAREYILYGMDGLTNAKRGDGSILKIRARDFVPFEDVNAYLENIAEKEKLKFKKTFKDGYYLVEVENGEGAVQPFTTWAKTMMGTRFDRQFNVQANVDKERAIRAEQSKNPAMSNTEALHHVVDKYVRQFQQSMVHQYQQVKNTLDNVDIQLAKMQKAYPNGVPATADPKVKQLYQHLTNTRPVLEKQVQDVYNNSVSFNKDPHGAIAANLETMLAENYKGQTAAAWAYSRAMGNQQQDIKPDEVMLTRFREAQANARNAASNATSLKAASIHETGATQRANMEIASKFKLAEYNAQLKGKLPGEQVIGSWMPQGQDDITPVDRYSKITSSTLGKIKDQAFGAGGFMEYIMNTDQDRMKMPAYQGAVGKLFSMSQGEQVQLDQRDITMLGDLFSKVSKDRKHVFNVPHTPGAARAELGELIANGYIEAGRQLDMDHSGKRTTMSDGTVKAMRETWKLTGNMLRKYAQAEDHFQNAARGLFIDPASGHVKDDYDGKVSIVGYSNGKPLLDVNTDDNAIRGIIGDRLPAEYKVQSRQGGAIINLTGITPKEMYTFMHAANSNDPGVKVTGMTPGLSQMSVQDQIKYFGSSAEVRFDPAGERAIVRLYKSSSAKLNKEDGDSKHNSTQVVEIALPYSKLQGLERFSTQKYKSVPDPAHPGAYKQVSLGSWIENQGPLGTSLTHTSQVLQDPHATVTAPSFMQHNGFNYSLRPMTDINGTPGFQLDFELTGVDGSKTRKSLPFIPANTGDVEGTLQNIDNTIDKIYDGWSDLRKSHENRK